MLNVEIYGRSNRPIVDAIYATWARLPAEAQRALENVRFTYNQHPERKAYASAGDHDIDVRELPVLSDAASGVIVHELAHVAQSHAQKLRAGQISVQEAERQADDLACRWGFTAEIQARKYFIGR